MGKYGLGKTNSNGYELLNFAFKNNLVLSNTTFNHNISQRITWESPEKLKPNASKITGLKMKIKGIISGNFKIEQKKIENIQTDKIKSNKQKQRKNKPVKNQIDYILIRKKHMPLITDSRSYSEFKTFTDHRMLIISTKIKDLKKYNPRNKNKLEKKIDFDKLKQAEYQKKFHDKVQEEVEKVKDTKDIQEKWSIITQINKKAAEEELGHQKAGCKKSTNVTIIKLSDEQLSLKMKILNTADKDKRVQMKRDRNKILRNIKKN